MCKHPLPAPELCAQDAIAPAAVAFFAMGGSFRRPPSRPSAPNFNAASVRRSGAGRRAVVIFSYAITQEVRNAPMAVLNRDTGIEGAALLKYMGRQPTFRSMFLVRNEQEIDTAIDQRKATAVMVIPPDFTRRLADSSPCPAQINLILDGRRPNASPILAGYIQRIVQKALLGSLREECGSGRGVGFCLRIDLTFLVS